MGFGDFLKGIVKVGAPVLGTALGGPVGGALGGALGSAVTGGNAVQGAIGGGLGGLTSKIPGLQSVGQFLGGNGGMNALGLAEGANAAYLGKKAGDLSDSALNSVRDAYNANAPLREAGRAAMLHPEAGIAAKIAAIPQGANPYAAPRPGLAPAATTPPAAPMLGRVG